MDPKFASVNITFQDGALLTGFILNDAPDTLSLKLMGGVEKVIKKSEIKKVVVSKLSSMPDGLAQSMSYGEFLDLVEFLSTL